MKESYYFIYMHKVDDELLFYDLHNGNFSPNSVSTGNDK